jgi:outer membrane immunogenic protein
MRKIVFLFSAALVATPALAQTDGDHPFDGIYVGGSVGAAVQPNDGGKSSILFDRDLNGSFGDTVTTVAGADAFSPGFCGGAATGTANTDCTNDKDGVEYYGRIGADTHMGPVVIGVMGEFGRPEINDSVTAFSTTPARYTMTRTLDYTASIRGRVGLTPLPARTTLFYATGGALYGKVKNSFSTSNTANSFTLNGDKDAWGFSGGGGIEQKIGQNFSIGLEYIYNELKDDKGRVRVGPGTAPPATNPFLLAGAGGTDFRRSDDKFRWHSLRVTAAFRF